MRIRKYTDKDLARIKELVLELHDYVQVFDIHMPNSSLIINDYFNYLLNKVKETNGTIHVAELDSEIAGCCVQFGRVLNDEPDEIKFYYSYISDLIITKRHRNMKIGKLLLNAAETYAKQLNVEHIYLSAFSENSDAVNFYHNNGYKSRVVSLRKNIK